MRQILSLVAATWVLGCGGGSSGADVDCTNCEVPDSRSELEPFLERGDYLSFARESAPHPSAGPHFGDVVTYLSPALEASLAAGNTTHPVGAGSVKELFGRDGSTEPLGFTVYVKVLEGDGPESYYWYESFEGRRFADGVDEGVCTGCHSASSSEVVLSNFPLE